MTNILFAGTGGDTYVISRGIRHASTLVITYDRMQLVINPGPGFLHAAHACSIPIRATTAVICTSPDSYAVSDLNVLVRGMTSDGADINGVIVGTPSVVEGSPEQLAIFRKPFTDYVERILVAMPDKKIGIESADFTFFPILSEDDSVGMRILLPDLSIGFIPHTGYSDKMARLYEGCDVLIVSVLLPMGMKSKYALSSDDAVKCIQRVKPKLAVITGFGKAMLENDPLQEARYIHGESKVQVIAASDGQVISPSSYSAKGKQQQLRKYQ